MTIVRPERTLFLLVTCSRDASRRDMAMTVTKNVVDRLAVLGLTDRLVVFDNASTYKDHLALLPAGARICASEENLGYWSAAKWVLDHLSELASFSCDFLYTIESDLIHADLAPLGMCERFLDSEPTASSVRTQEFSVRFRWRFDKRLRFLPFHVERSQVSLRNAVTNERAWFRSANGFPGIYLSNLHPKLPSLQRVSLLKEVFNILAARAGFVEGDYFAEAMKARPLIGVLDGGVYHAMSTSGDPATVVSGSWSSPEQQAKVGYFTTRVSNIKVALPGVVGMRIVGNNSASLV
jgi:hypothetical protein